MFTLGDLQSFYRLEKESAKLQEMPQEFRIRVKTLLENPQAKEYESEINDLYKKILKLRRNKILKYCMGPQPKTPLENETPDDRSFREQVLKNQKKYFEDIENPDTDTALMHESVEKKEKPKKIGSKQVVKEKDKDYIEVKFTQDMPEMMGVDGEKYGPYKDKDTALLPKDNANILLKKNIAETTG